MPKLDDEAEGGEGGIFEETAVPFLQRISANLL